MATVKRNLTAQNYRTMRDELLAAFHHLVDVAETCDWFKCEHDAIYGAILGLIDCETYLTEREQVFRRVHQPK